MTIESNAKLGGMLCSYDALRNWQALLLLVGGGLFSALIVAAAAKTGIEGGGAAVATILFLAALFVLALGVNAAGVALVDQADQREFRGFVAAIFDGAGATVQLLGATVVLAVALGVCFGLLFAASRLALIPKMHGIVSFLLAGPSVVALAVAYAVVVLGVPLIAVAIWQGDGFFGALLRVADVVVRRPLALFLHFLVLLLIVFAAAAFVFSLTTIAGTQIDAMYAMQFGGLLTGIHGMFAAQGPHLLLGPLSGLQAVVENIAGASLSIAVVYLLLWGLFILIYMYGVIYLYRAVGEGVDAGVSVRMRAWAGTLKEKADQARTRKRPVSASAVQATVHAGTAERSSTHCLQCGQILAADDLFCGGCGAAVGERR